MGAPSAVGILRRRDPAAERLTVDEIIRPATTRNVPVAVFEHLGTAEPCLRHDLPQ
ncbi:hypothetical protein [Actinomadura macrotermitis]|uniref:hypothetical protein n=1 Tax=Actinomadura macrotermitis TaxID=2585200 RepID=UPI0018869A9F|nr:hypothetical protein [Actinomadura macrotermitis]